MSFQNDTQNVFLFSAYRLPHNYENFLLFCTLNINTINMNLDMTTTRKFHSWVQARCSLILSIEQFLYMKVIRLLQANNVQLRISHLGILQHTLYLILCSNLAISLSVLLPSIDRISIRNY